MAFTEQDARTVKRWMDERAPAAACPLCRRAGDWALVSSDGVRVAGADMLACRNCGHIEWLSRDVMGF
jgi:hypothetical protein